MSSLFDFFFKSGFCRHENVDLNTKFQYCPDCGELIEVSWYVLRCSCCGIKRDASTRFNKIVPRNNFCTNCGEKDFYVEKIDDLKFYDVHHAISFKEVVFQHEKRAYMQIWTDSDESAHIKVLKLLPLLTEHKRVS